MYVAGSNISSYASKHLHKYIFQQEAYFDGDVKGSIEEVRIIYKIIW